jgi:predicted DNA-binding transcriptional regulator AlpA
VNTASPVLTDRLVDSKWVAEYLGVSRRWVDDNVRREHGPDRLPHVPVGRFVRFRPEAIVAWAAAREVG